ncbi:hypothetical protein O9K51_04190 [Purpureocillium lavendulum]|uniref:Uncharacterized protein n=1 Tax=Purpureocillium lavendulum TaxID=1247861 RepID=A0AB34FW52_9HYPO|nr:hypothetical protein O9K51_04190 [Purpureocillium lavendulum]
MPINDAVVAKDRKGKQPVRPNPGAAALLNFLAAPPAAPAPDVDSSKKAVRTWTITTIPRRAAAIPMFPGESPSGPAPKEGVGEAIWDGDGSLPVAFRFRAAEGATQSEVKRRRIARSPPPTSQENTTAGRGC